MWTVMGVKDLVLYGGEWEACRAGHEGFPSKYYYTQNGVVNYLSKYTVINWPVIHQATK